jgi:tetratricopeptide (TPR) repeat protein
VLCALPYGSFACGWNPSRPFDRDAPLVKRAIGELDAGDASAATATLEDYLSTGKCDDSKIGAPDLLKKRANGAFDLGLSLFAVGEAYGRRFGDEESENSTGAGHAAEGQGALREAQVECALRIVRAITEGPSGSPAQENEDTRTTELLSRARYVEGNLLFLGGRYEEAVKAYDESLRLSPGLPDAGDPVARDAAWNRAVALRRIEDKKDAGPDASPDSGNDGGGDSGGDGGQDNKDSGAKDGGGDSGGGNDAGGDSGKNDNGDSGADSAPPPKPRDDEDAGPPPPPRANQDERMLDQLENAPTVQQEAAKKAAQKRRVRGTQDK